MEKLSLGELRDKDNWKKAVIVFKDDNFLQEYTLKERSYTVSSNSNYFDRNKISTSLIGDCLDGKDIGVRLDLYGWEVEYCYIIE